MRILVAMSGGVDSSAVCLLLQEQGYEVVGMTMRVWDLPCQFAHAANANGTLPACPQGQVADATLEPDFILSARTLAERLGIEHHVVDVRTEFRDTVVRYFLDEYEAGRTPNPCVLCNRAFKFRLLAELADRLGCPLMATGHYVQTQEHDGHTYLLRATTCARTSRISFGACRRRCLVVCASRSARWRNPPCAPTWTAAALPYVPDRRNQWRYASLKTTTAISCANSGPKWRRE